TGVLPVCLGKATKLCDLLTDTNKIYEATLLLGITTDTQDMSGTIISECQTNELIQENVVEVIAGFVGPYEQIPPMYSALKVNGKKLYELAREGKTIERKSRTVTIYNIEILQVSLPRVQMRVSCSKGTYIRTLCHDIGAKLQCGGCMETLRRTSVGGFEIAKSITLSEVEKMKQNDTLMNVITPIDAMFQNYKVVKVKNESIALVYNGNPFSKANMIDPTEFGQDEKIRVYNESNDFIAIYQYQQSKDLFEIVKMFFDQNELV
ncbi:MAG: tRNA pseudouridine(55) synthase TruB, partial [Lachnospiraceae bacterium]|nr:tRNA pseudouridine(55) synthase TruB [Lachnospiraceae bacterium]